VKVMLPARVACKSMNRVQEQKHHLALANRQIAGLKVQIVRQRVQRLLQLRLFRVQHHVG
jgi:hypothetical protein